VRPRAEFDATLRGPRFNASGTDIYLQPGQLGRKYDEHVEVSASPATRWAYRRSQLNTPNGYLVLGTLAAAATAAWIGGRVFLLLEGEMAPGFAPLSPNLVCR
jgi:hypothetical protein